MRGVVSGEESQLAVSRSPYSQDVELRSRAAQHAQARAASVEGFIAGMWVGALRQSLRSARYTPRGSGTPPPHHIDKQELGVVHHHVVLSVRCPRCVAAACRHENTSSTVLRLLQPSCATLPQFVQRAARTVGIPPMYIHAFDFVDILRHPCPSSWLVSQQTVVHACGTASVVHLRL
ncbi:hypothetical protein BV20DRAFT_541294 [Pilatotrama ljubarskyi]|nr:hypothetical protein BV20DRAFT_541294 [Pilatotrama ljubarskyi]